MYSYHTEGEPHPSSAWQGAPPASSPEAVEGGPIALIENDDLIEIDIPNRRLNIVGVKGQKKTPEEITAILAERKKNWKLPQLKPKSPVQRLYSKLAVSAMAGAYLDV